MGVFNKLSDFILPKEVDFFGSLGSQSAITQEVVYALHRIYVEKTLNSAELNTLIQKADDLRKKNVLELNKVLITPIDREAISRAYLNLDWIVLSIKHLDVEIATYAISSLKEYEKIFSMLKEQMCKITECFGLLKAKNYLEVLDRISEVIRLDDDQISEYSRQLADLFDSNALKHIMRHKEILSQLKEVSKRIHVCANTVEDIVFKMY